MSIEIHQLIKDRKLKYNLHRRVAQMKERNAAAISDPERKLEKLKFFVEMGSAILGKLASKISKIVCNIQFLLHS